MLLFREQLALRYRYEPRGLYQITKETNQHGASHPHIHSHMISYKSMKSSMH